MPVSQREFVEAAMSRLGINQTDLGKLAGEDNAYTQAHSWYTERLGMPFDAVIRISERCGWLRVDPTPLADDLLEAARAAAEKSSEDAGRLLAERRAQDNPGRGASK